MAKFVKIERYYINPELVVSVAEVHGTTFIGIGERGAIKVLLPADEVVQRLEAAGAPGPAEG